MIAILQYCWELPSLAMCVLLAEARLLKGPEREE
jgi:hypothetical protein